VLQIFAEFGDGDDGLKDFEQSEAVVYWPSWGTVGAFEGGVGASELHGAGRSSGREGRDGAAGVRARAMAASVVGADEQGVNQVMDGDSFAGDERNVARLDLGIGLFDGDVAVEGRHVRKRAGQ